MNLGKNQIGAYFKVDLNPGWLTCGETLDFLSAWRHKNGTLGASIVRVGKLDTVACSRARGCFASNTWGLNCLGFGLPVIWCPKCGRQKDDIRRMLEGTNGGFHLEPFVGRLSSSFQSSPQQVFWPRLGPAKPVLGNQNAAWAMELGSEKLFPVPLT